MEDLVLSVKQCKHLQELGLDMSDAKMCWTKAMDEYTVVPMTKNMLHPERVIPTYTLQEIFEKLPRAMSWSTWNWELLHSGDEFQYNDGDGYFSLRIQHKGFLETAYEALCWVIEKGYLKNK